MKRVHDYTGSTNETCASSPAESQAPKPRVSSVRKKKSTTDAGVQKKQKVTKASNRKQLQQLQQQQQRQEQQEQRQQQCALLQEKFKDTKRSLIELLNQLTGPDDLEAEHVDRLTADLGSLSKIASTHKSSVLGASGD
jgi:hypothetical protein